jgi:hypothetical protein
MLHGRLAIGACRIGTRARNGTFRTPYACAYFQNTARALMRDQDMGESEAIATAINAVKEWAAGRAFGGHVNVTPEVQQAAQRALQEWEHLKETHHP